MGSKITFFFIAATSWNDWINTQRCRRKGSALSLCTFSWLCCFCQLWCVSAVTEFGCCFKISTNLLFRNLPIQHYLEQQQNPPLSHFLVLCLCLRYRTHTNTTLFNPILFSHIGYHADISVLNINQKQSNQILSCWWSTVSLLIL